MTERQLRLIAREFSEARRIYTEEERLQKVIDCLAISVANAINGSSTNLNREVFLRECGHPDYSQRGLGLGITKSR